MLLLCVIVRQARVLNASSPWLSMANSFGAVWEASQLPEPPLDIRITNSVGEKVCVCLCLCLVKVSVYDCYLLFGKHNRLFGWLLPVRPCCGCCFSADHLCSMQPYLLVVVIVAGQVHHLLHSAYDQAG